MSSESRQLRPRLAEADLMGTSICRYCAVGCAQLVYSKNGRAIHIEGGPRSHRRLPAASRRRFALSSRRYWRHPRLCAFLEAISDPEHPDHEDRIDWYGGIFDPKAIDLDRIRKELTRLAARRKRTAAKRAS